MIDKEVKTKMSDNVKNILEWAYCIIIALVLALLFRYFIATPTIVKQRSMYPTLQSDQRLILNRTMRITKKMPQVGDIITFEAPTKTYTPEEASQSNPVAVYENEPVDTDCCFESGDKNEIMEWNLGYSEKGYLNMCAKCFGYLTINQHRVEPGVQLQ